MVAVLALTSCVDLVKGRYHVLCWGCLQLGTTSCVDLGGLLGCVSRSRPDIGPSQSRLLKFPPGWTLWHCRADLAMPTS